MNGKFEEKLAQLAFGDLSPEEAAQVEAQVARNPEASRALSEYRDMCGGLRSLAAVPEHQLSNERLRNAILTQGLRAKPVEQPSKRSNLGWVWMPVMACALGFGLITMRNRPVGDPHIVIQGNGMGLASNLNLTQPMLSDPSGHDMRTAISGAAKKPTPAVTVAMTHEDESDPRTLPREKRAKRFTDDKILRPKWGPITVPEENPAGRLALNTDPKGTAPVQNPAAQPVAMSSPIVLIDANPDSETGAPVATEVGTASNILIGG